MKQFRNILSFLFQLIVLLLFAVLDNRKRPSVGYELRTPDGTGGWQLIPTELYSGEAIFEHYDDAVTAASNISDDLWLNKHYLPVAVFDGFNISAGVLALCMQGEEFQPAYPAYEDSLDLD